ncbi:MAG TPA: ribonuclease R [Acidiferrobacteraceae bacterium]|nr:ribonuclease R [Acidiferrobacteraceae bacterium]
MSNPNKDAPVDPMIDRETRTYKFPVPSREMVLDHLGAIGEQQAFKEICRALAVTGERDIEAFGRRLRAMERDGQLFKNRRGRYGVAAKMDMICGRVMGHADGFGFLIPDEGGEDLFLAPRDMRQVLHGDRAMARVVGVDHRGRRQGAIVEVLEHHHHSIVGRLINENGMDFVVPDDKRITQDILIPPGERGDAQHGQIVVARIVAQPSRRSRPAGRISEVLGDHMAPGLEVEIAIRKHEIPVQWPEAVSAAADALPAQVPEDQKQNRQDLRDLALVTIDGVDSRDFDDAVYCESKMNGYRLIVAIADVSSYVQPNSDLDQEAYQRGNSVYFPLRVIPMLPEALSNGLCSLNPDVDRLCVVCDMDIDQQGIVKGFRFYEAVMRSQARLTYNQAAAILIDKDQGLIERHRPVLSSLYALYDLYKILRAARHKRGAVDLDLPETRIVYDDNKRIECIVPTVRNDAHRLIEECMLAANVCAADLLAKHKHPSLYRIHEGPSADKLEDLRSFLGELGLHLGGGDKPDSKDYGNLIDQLEGRSDIALVQTVLLRSLSQAMYSPDNVGHFALGYVNYTHFTSPIRRYPDLMVHRAIKHVISGKPIAKDKETQASVNQQGEHCSMTERRADDATRDVIGWLKAEFMMGKVGEVFEGKITGVTGFGIFVELKEIFVEGLVHVTALGNDYYHFDPAHHRLIGEHTANVFRLGDELKVKVVRVDLDEARIDFEIESSPGGEGGRKRNPKRDKRTKKTKKGAKRVKKSGRAPKERKRRKR